MNPEQKEKLIELCAAAAELDAPERAAFLDAACAGEAEMRAELESLLAFAQPHETEGRPVWEKLRLPRQDLTGQQLSHYQIQTLLGAGGMGEVWQAKDNQLGRIVAIKILPPEFSADAERVQRFEREARAASALNHPNILTVHEVGTVHDVHFIVTELVDGKTLRQRLKAVPLALSEALEIAVQIGKALVAAHEIGIVHRDIKPENIMLRRDGYVKVLDFGIAKLIERRRKNAAPRDIERRAAALPLREVALSATSPGRTMGTPGYMSPEQARGLAVDARTDLFSLGVVLYEMITGLAPFIGATSLEAIEAILENEPPPIPPAVPPALAQIVRQALHKNREERYQSAAALLADLNQLKKQLAAGNEDALAAAVPAAPPPRTAEHGWRSWLRHPAVLSLLVMTAFGFSAWQLVRGTNRPLLPERAVSFTKLVGTAGIEEAAISPDGKYVAYTKNESLEQGLWVRQVGTTNEIQILPQETGAIYQAPTFSPDSAAIYYLRYDAQRDVKELYRVAVTGGTPQYVLERIDSPVGVSPDGQQLAFIRYDREHKQSALLVTQADGSGARQLVTRQEPLKLFAGRPAWDASGLTLAYAAGTPPHANDHQIYEIPAAGGSERLLTIEPLDHVTELAWLKDRSGLILLADYPINTLLHLSLAEGKKQRLSGENVSELEGYHSLSLTADETALVTVRTESIHLIQVLSAHDLTQARVLASGKQEGHDGLGWTPDGRMLYASKVDGSSAIWRIDADGRNGRRVPTSGVGADQPCASADGRYLVYSAVSPQPAGKSTHNIWRANADGSQPQQLTFGGTEFNPVCSPDSRWVVYIVRHDNGRRSLWKVPLEGGEAVQLTPETAANPSAAFSPDGKLLAYYHRGAEVQGKRIRILSFETGQLVQTLALPYTAYLLQWIEAGRALCYAKTQQGVTNLWRLPLDGRAPQPMTAFKSDVIVQFAWSPDGTQLACTRQVRNDDVLLLRAFR